MTVDLFTFTETRRYGDIESTVSTTLLTSSDIDEVHSGDAYTSTVMGRNRPQVTSETTKAKMEISFSIDNSFAQEWLGEKENILEVEVVESGDSGDDIVWRGRMSNITIKGDKIALTFDSIFTSIVRNGLNRNFQRTCSHTLFDAQCGLDRDLFSEPATITSMSDDGLILTVTGLVSFDNDYFTYGVVTSDSGVSRFIEKHEFNLLTISKASQVLVDELAQSGTISISVYPGCTKSRDTCENKFANELNHGGFPFMPYRDVFNKISIV